MVDEGEMEEAGEMGETMMTSLWMRERVSMHWRGVGDDWVIVEDEVVQGWVRPMGEATEVVATKMTFHENNKDNKDNKDKRERNQNTISVTPKENRLTNPFLISRTTLFRRAKEWSQHPFPQQHCIHPCPTTRHMGPVRLVNDTQRCGLKGVCQVDDALVSLVR